MTSVAVSRLQCFPLTLADIRDNEIIIPRAASWKWMERISRKVCTEIGSIAATCKAPRSGREVKDHTIHYTTTKAIELGYAVQEARRNHHDPVAAIIKACSGHFLFEGKVVDVERKATEGFLRGKALIQGLSNYADQEFLVHFQNEFSVGYLNGDAIVMTPDLICVLDTVSGDGIGTDVLRYGQRVSVLALPGPEIFRTQAGLDAVGPRAFGFDLDYECIFDKV
jgi:DUF917 family protein